MFYIYVNISVITFLTWFYSRICLHFDRLVMAVVVEIAGKIFLASKLFKTGDILGYNMIKVKVKCFVTFTNP